MTENRFDKILSENAASVAGGKEKVAKEYADLIEYLKSNLKFDAAPRRRPERPNPSPTAPSIARARAILEWQEKPDMQGVRSFFVTEPKSSESRVYLTFGTNTLWDGRENERNILGAVGLDCQTKRYYFWYGYHVVERGPYRDLKPNRRQFFDQRELAEKELLIAMRADGNI